MEKLIKELIFKALLKANFLVDFPLKKEEIEVKINENPLFGDYSSNISFIISKKLKTNPQVVAEKLVSLIKSFKKAKYFKEINSINGFINFTLSEKVLLKEFKEILKLKENYGKEKLKKQTVIIDYSSPNIAKNFGIGHLRSTIVGAALYNLFKFLGWKVIGDNHLGDWGTQFGKLLYQINEDLLKNKSLKEKEKILNNLTIDELEKLYVKFHKLAEKDPSLNEKGKEWFKKLENKDKEAVKIWKKCIKVSLKEFHKIYKLLKVKFDLELGESFYEEEMKKVLEELKKKNLLKESEGAEIIEFPNQLPPAIILKSDKTTTYFLRDLATLRYRLRNFKPSLIIYEVGLDQKLYFEQLFEAAKLLNWVKKVKLVHVGHGLIRWPEGKFSTRKGDTIHFKDVLEELKLKVKELIEKSETRKNLTLKEKENISLKIALSALKYFILSYHYESDIIFDWQKILDLEGNSGPYLQYSLTRCFSVLKKAKSIKVKKIENFPSLTEEEILILRQLVLFKSILKICEKNFSINILCNYLFELASRFNNFYQKQPILKAESKNLRDFRLQLVLAVSYIFQISFKILTLEILKKM